MSLRSKEDFLFCYILTFFLKDPLRNINNVRRWQDITEMDLSNTRLYRLPAKLGIMPNLTRLNLSRNALSVYWWSWLKQESIRKKLLFLDISYNSLPNISEYIYGLEALEELNISHNRLTRLPQGIENLRNLQTLNLSHNRLAYLPMGISLLRMQSIDISMNPFGEIQTDLFLNVLYPNLAYRAAKTLEQYCRSENVAFQTSLLDEIISRTTIGKCFFCEKICTMPFKHAMVSYRCGFIPIDHVLTNAIYTQTDYTTLVFDCYYCFPKCETDILNCLQYSDNEFDTSRN